VKEMLVNRFGDKIITNHFDLSRTSVDGMKNAVVDLWCLAKTDRIIGSANSTYSTFAAQIYGKELGILRQRPKS